MLTKFITVSFLVMLCGCVSQDITQMSTNAALSNVMLDVTDNFCSDVQGNEELLQSIMEFYEETFTDEELKSILRFYTDSEVEVILKGKNNDIKTINKLIEKKSMYLSDSIIRKVQSQSFKEKISSIVSSYLEDHEVFMSN